MPKVPLPEAEWECVDMFNAEKEWGQRPRCTFCRRSLKWVHIIRHPDVRQDKVAGCYCAARRCSEYDATAAETAAMNREQRRLRFLNAEQWKTTQNGNPCRDRRIDGTEYKFIVSSVPQQPGYYRVSVINRDTGEWLPLHWKTQPSVKGAKEYAFEIYDSLREEAETDETP